MRNEKKKMMLIAGPCAAESEEQIRVSIAHAKKRDVDFMRVNLWKPRTRPGFEGLSEDGLHLLALTAKEEVNPGCEVITARHAERAIETVLKASSTAKILIWIGARNQNHFVQQEIARVAKGEKRVMLMVKNQPWRSQEHWEGIIEHVLHAGIDRENVLNCHRGFTPHGYDNPHGYRNVADFIMAMEVKEKLGLPMIFDPSHIGGTVENVLRVIKESVEYPFDGYIIEVHPNPKEAKTDAKQQLTWEQFDEVKTIVG